jgi:hypothetical protein
MEYPAKSGGSRLFKLSRKFGSELLYRIEGKPGLFYRVFDSEGDYILKPLREGTAIYDGLAHKMYYRKYQWD